MYYIKIFGRMLELQNKKVGRTISRPESLRAAKMHVKKHFSTLEDRTIYVGLKFNEHGTVLEYTKVL